MPAPLSATLDIEEASALVALNWSATNLMTNPSFRTAGANTVLRTNSVINPALTSSSTGWLTAAGTGGAVVNNRMTSGGPTLNGQTLNYFRMTWTTAPSNHINSGPIYGSHAGDYALVTASTTHTVSAYVRASVLDRTVAWVLTFADSAGTTVGSTLTGPVFNVGGTEWARVSFTFSVPAGATRTQMRLYTQGGTNWIVGDTIDATGILLEASSAALLDYFDGDSPPAAQTGWTHTWQGSGTPGTVPSNESGVNVTNNIAYYSPAGMIGGKTTDAEVYRITARNPIAGNRIMAFQAAANVPCLPGEFVSFRLQARQVAGPPVALDWRALAYTAGGVSLPLPNIMAQIDDVTLNTDGSWTDVAAPAIAAAGATSATARILIYRNPSAAVDPGVVIELRHVLVQKELGVGGTPASYFDGSMTGYHWNGTPDVSTSSLNSATTATIERVNLTTGAVLPVRNAEPATLIVNEWIGRDYETPLDAEFYYRATSPDVPGLELLSDTYSIPALDRSMLKHPGRPALNASVRIGAAPSLSRPVTQGVFEVLGRQTPVAVSMRRSSARGELEVLTFDSAEREALLLLLDDGTPLLLQTPSGYGVGNVYISVGEVSEARVTGVGSEWTRRWTLPFVIVDRPAGEALAVGNTWADVLATYSSWDAMRTAEGSWAGVLEGVGS